MFLFCYGSNNPKQLEERLERRVKTYPAFILGYQRIYRGWSNKWQGGVGSLKKMPGKICYGLAVEVDKHDIENMDYYEGYPSYYSKKHIKGYVNGESEKMLVYLAKSKEWNAPSVAYLKAIYKTVSTHWDVSSYKDFYNEY